MNFDGLIIKLYYGYYLEIFDFCFNGLFFNVLLFGNFFLRDFLFYVEFIIIFYLGFVLNLSLFYYKMFIGWQEIFEYGIIWGGGEQIFLKVDIMDQIIGLFDIILWYDIDGV